MYKRMKYVERRASQFLSVHFLSINGQCIKPLQGFILGRRLLGKWVKKNDLTLKNDLKLEKSFLYCERIKCNGSKSNFATFKCQKGPSIDFDPPTVLVLLLFALWDFYVSCESEVLVILTIPTFLCSLIQNLCIRFEFRSFDWKSIFIRPDLTNPKVILQSCWVVAAAMVSLLEWQLNLFCLNANVKTYT